MQVDNLKSSINQTKSHVKKGKQLSFNNHFIFLAAWI